jgi:hypothetical protein
MPTRKLHAMTPFSAACFDLDVAPYVFTPLERARGYSGPPGTKVTYPLVLLKPGANVESVRTQLRPVLSNAEVLRLYASTKEHLYEFATLRAIGSSRATRSPVPHPSLPAASVLSAVSRNQVRPRYRQKDQLESARFASSTSDKKPRSGAG